MDQLFFKKYIILPSPAPRGGGENTYRIFLERHHKRPHRQHFDWRRSRSLVTGLVGQPQDSPVIGGGGDVDASSLNAPTGILGALVQRHGGAAATAAMALVISSAEGASFTVAEKRKKSRHTTKQPARGRQYQVKSRFTLLGGKTAMCRGGGPRAQGLVRAGVVPTNPRSLERVRREMSHLLVVYSGKKNEPNAPHVYARASCGL